MEKEKLQVTTPTDRELVMSRIFKLLKAGMTSGAVETFDKLDELLASIA